MQGRMTGLIKTVVLCLALLVVAQVDAVSWDGDSSADSTYDITVDGSQILAELRHFWRSTGFCPPKPHQDVRWWFLGKDMQQNLQYIGSIPNAGIEQVRIHWLLDLVSVRRFESGKPVYDFSNLDWMLDLLRYNNLKPGFEIMGNPSSIFNDLENKTQVTMWKDLVSQMANRYVDILGLDYVKTWNFETWNEPDHQGEYDLLKFNVQAFNNYYDACSEGLKEGSSQLVFGGPGASCRNADFSKICWGLLDHVENGHNFFTGDKGVRIDYISFHNKGLPPNNAGYILKTDIETAITIHHLHPKLVNVSIVNEFNTTVSEHFMDTNGTRQLSIKQISWSDAVWWRADATYAAMVVKVIAQHQYNIVANPDLGIFYGLLSNDNGFLSYQPDVFSQRTLLARFQINSTMPQHTEMIRKPVYSVMGLLSLLGEVQLKVNISDGYNLKYPDGDVGTIATYHKPDGLNPQDSWQAGVVVYSSKDSSPITGSTPVKVTLTKFNPPTNKDLVMVRYSLDNMNGNPFRVWNASGRPATPNWKVLQQMRLSEDPVRVVGPEAVNLTSALSMTMTLPLPGVTLIHICAKADSPPKMPFELRLVNVTAGKVLISWAAAINSSKCVLTYEVEFSQKSLQGPYQRINSQDTIFNIFMFSPNPALLSTGADPYTLVKGYYRVRVIDYFKRMSQYSTVVQF